MSRGLALVICVLSGCATFEDPSIVLDLRILAMTASLDPFVPLNQPVAGPEQVIDVDLEHPNPTEILAQLAPTTICGYVADPVAHRELRWKMTVCLLDLDDRCDLTHPVIELGSGLLGDPDDSVDPQVPCADLIPDQTLLTILREAVMANPVQALGGIEYGVVLAIDDPAMPGAAVYAAKHLRLAARIPVNRERNTNPFISYLDAAVTGIGLLIPKCRCANALSAACDIPTVKSGAVVTLFPVEPDHVREEYFAPKLDGSAAKLEETITYQWLAANGSFSDETTGGGHDVLGNQSLLGTEWHAPRGHKAQILVPLWMIQRDERYGVNLLETCLRVDP
ncbi:MAG: hypothetical protein IPQ07_16615 [Myxococcales bacterium]|nr:hypothetical protein [Myxococcales bacterium]